PKKYAPHLITLMRHFPQAAATSHIETTTAVLGVLWHCDPEEVPRLLRLMTVRSHGSMTYGLGARQQGLGVAVDISLVVDLTKGQPHEYRTGPEPRSDRAQNAPASGHARRSRGPSSPPGLPRHGPPPVARRRGGRHGGRAGVDAAADGGGSG